jgi:hypothetical protein
MSSGSGIPPTQETLALVDELRKNNSRYIFALFKIDSNQVVPAEQWPNSDDDVKLVQSLKSNGGDNAVAAAFEKQIWPKFVRALEQADGPRFAVIDFSFNTGEGRVVRTLTSIGYCTDRTAARLKMAFASTKTAFEAKINIGKKYQANDPSDLEYPTVFEALKKI